MTRGVYSMRACGQGYDDKRCLQYEGLWSRI